MQSLVPQVYVPRYDLLNTRLQIEKRKPFSRWPTARDPSLSHNVGGGGGGGGDWGSGVGPGVAEPWGAHGPNP